MKYQDCERFMRQALSLADCGRAAGEVPVGALVVHDGVIIGQGHNVRETEQDPTGHAEMLAMRQAAQHLGSWRLEDCWVVATLEPCPMCAGALVQARVAGCVYGCSDPKSGFLGSLADVSAFPGLNHRFPVISGVMADEASVRLQRFFRQLRDRKH